MQGKSITLYFIQQDGEYTTDRYVTESWINEQNFATRFAPFVNERNVMGIMDELSEAQLHIEQNVNAKMVFFDFSLKMIVLLKQ